MKLIFTTKEEIEIDDKFTELVKNCLDGTIPREKLDLLLEAIIFAAEGDSSDYAVYTEDGQLVLKQEIY